MQRQIRRAGGREAVYAVWDGDVMFESPHGSHGIAMGTCHIVGGGPSELETRRTPLSTLLVQCLSIKQPASHTPSWPPHTIH